MKRHFVIALTLACCVRTAPQRDDCNAQTPLVAGAPGTLQQARSSLARGEAVVKMFERHRRLRCAWPTSPADRSGAFDDLPAIDALAL